MPKVIVVPFFFPFLSIISIFNLNSHALQIVDLNVESSTLKDCWHFGICNIRRSASTVLIANTNLGFESAHAGVFVCACVCVCPTLKAWSYFIFCDFDRSHNSVHRHSWVLFSHVSQWIS
jgi:hypothetical protein